MCKVFMKIMHLKYTGIGIHCPLMSTDFSLLLDPIELTNNGSDSESITEAVLVVSA